MPQGRLKPKFYCVHFPFSAFSFCVWRPIYCGGAFGACVFGTRWTRLEPALKCPLHSRNSLIFELSNIRTTNLYENHSPFTELYDFLFKFFFFFSIYLVIRKIQKFLCDNELNLISNFRLYNSKGILILFLNLF